MTPATALFNDALAEQGRWKETLCDDDHCHWPLGCHPLTHGFAAREEREFGIPFGTCMAIVRTWLLDTPVPDRYKGLPPARFGSSAPPYGPPRYLFRGGRAWALFRGGQP